MLHLSSDRVQCEHSNYGEFLKRQRKDTEPNESSSISTGANEQPLTKGMPNIMGGGLEPRRGGIPCLKGF